ncbi:hypothetical protein [Streptomyces sp. NPDC056544]|uniref:hypothetical protein n=1 Tax=Streptomyces sp. NPDC056544 TaxID=3345863 RepID=UPI0036B6644A
MNSLSVEMRLKARGEIQRAVTGLTAEQIHEQYVAADGLENREGRPRPLSAEERLTAVRRNELRRIWTLMDGTGWHAYSPERDAQADRWRQALRDRQGPENGAAVEPDSEMIRYRIVAQRTDPAHPGASVVTNYTYARSVEEAVAKVRRAKEKPGGLYGDQGLYRVVEAVEESPQSEARQLQDARERFLTAAMDAAVASLEDQSASARPELLGILSDFFVGAVLTRAIVSPEDGAEDRPHLHARDGEALSCLLLTHLAHHGLNLVEATVRTGDRAALSEAVGVGRPSIRDTNAEEGSKAPAELVERVLDICGQHYADVTSTNAAQWDEELSYELLGVALRTVRLADREAYPQVLEEYLVAHRARLEKLWRVYGPNGVFPYEGVYHLIEQPESFVLCERIDRAPMSLKGVWGREWESDTPLERLEEAWMYGTSESDGR